VEKPVPRASNLNENLVGKALISTYPIRPSDDEEIKRVYLTQNYKVSLFGLSLTIESLPFQEQDGTIAVCATVACWISLFPLRDLFGTPMMAPIEVTEKSLQFPEENRNFPVDGLSAIQIKTFFNSIGLETEFILPEIITKIDRYSDEDDYVADVIRAYISLGLPVIAGLNFKTYNCEDPYSYAEDKDVEIIRHAVVISGYRYEHGRINELYVHDDGIGPYCRTLPVGQKFSKWKNEWLNEGITSIDVCLLIVPIYQKIRLPFLKIYKEYLRFKRQLDYGKPLKKEQESSDDRVILLLLENRKYKEWLHGFSFSHKLNVVTMPLPRYLWIIRMTNNNTPVYDYVYDATYDHAQMILKINFAK
jgi:hypothetical protein